MKISALLAFIIALTVAIGIPSNSEAQSNYQLRRQVSEVAEHYYDAEYDEAKVKIVQVVEAYREREVTDGDDYHYALYVAAVIHVTVGEPTIAETYVIEAVNGYLAEHGQEHPDSLKAISLLGSLYSDQDRYEEAQQLLNIAAYGLLRLNGPNDAAALSALNQAALNLHRSGELHQAEELFQTTVGYYNEYFDEDYTGALTTRLNLATLHGDMGRYELAISELEDIHDIGQRHHGWDHPNTLTTANNLATMYINTGRFEEAEDLLTTIADNFTERFGNRDLRTLTVNGNLGLLYYRMDRLEEAELLFRETADLLIEINGIDYSITMTALSNLAEVYGKLDRHQEAFDLFSRVYEQRANSFFK